jgi:Head domain of trimeric autotransporter adhesin/Chaperone of endosialidase
MLVFDSNTQSYWYRRSGTWTELPQSTAAVNFWQQTGAGGNEIKNTNTGGFWSANPLGLTATSDEISNPPTAPVSGAGTRMMWIPSRSAFRVGTVLDISGVGVESKYWDKDSVGLFSFASGGSTKAKGLYSTAMGALTEAIGTGSSAFGVRSKAIGLLSTALGNFSTASGYSSTAMGDNTTASGDYSTALTKNSTASGLSAFATGNNTFATGQFSTSMGFYTSASGDYSTAMGRVTQSIGVNSIAMGSYTTSRANSSTAIGSYNIDNPDGLFMVGNGATPSSRYTAFIIRRDNSRVGIGVENPIAPLHVAGFNFLSGNVNSYSSFFYPSSTSLTQNFTNAYQANTSILADEGIISKTYIGAVATAIASDNRIKNIISLSNNAEDLERLKKIQITNYRMKDAATWGTQTFKKVIAQQVEEVYPEVIKLQTSVIPDIYSLAESVTYDAATKNLSVTLLKEYNIKIGEKLELVHPEKGKILSEVISVSGNSFTVKDWSHATDKIFVFGRQVNDFRSVDYEALSMLGISAIQQLAKEVEELRITNDELRIKNEKLESKNNKTEARLEAIENLLKSNVPSGK